MCHLLATVTGWVSAHKFKQSENMYVALRRKIPWPEQKRVRGGCPTVKAPRERGSSEKSYFREDLARRIGGETATRRLVASKETADSVCPWALSHSLTYSFSGQFGPSTIRSTVHSNTEPSYHIAAEYIVETSAPVQPETCYCQGHLFKQHNIYA